MEKIYEYSLVVFRGNQDDIPKKLNKLAKEGFRVISTIRFQERGALWTLEREVKPVAPYR